MGKARKCSCRVSGLQGISDSLESIRNYDIEDTLVVGVGSSFSPNWLVHIWANFTRTILMLTFI
ncbi:MAG: hypothetical protein CM1200mP16_17270 [Nitrospina sp.]|nr:MAG: hypothetical protein CM1200mP16_17270 [Nitrospina sp.]